MQIQYQDKMLEVQNPIKIKEMLKEAIENSKYPVMGAKFNHEYVNLEYEICQDGEIELIDISSKEGTKIYRRTLIYILGKAFEKLYPDQKITVNYQLSNAMFCDVEETEITEEFVQKLSDEMKAIVEKDLPIKQVVMNREQAKEFYEKNHTSKGRLQLDLPNNQEIYMYYCEDYYNYLYDDIATIIVLEH